MKQLRLRTLCAAAAVGFALLCTASAQATVVSYTTIGTFTGGDTPGTSTYTDAANGILITFNNALNNSVNVPPTSQASLGQFDTSGTTAATLQSVLSGFTLSIFQSTPDAGGPLVFTGTLSGSLSIDNSQAVVQFGAPLSGNIFGIKYSIASADDQVPGKINLSASTSNAGLTTVQGRIGIVPEPASLALVGLGMPMLLVYGLRRRRSLATA